MCAVHQTIVKICIYIVRQHKSLHTQVLVCSVYGVYILHISYSKMGYMSCNTNKVITLLVYILASHTRS